MNTASLPTLWATCVERLKDKVNNRSFWEALEQTRPVTIESDTLIIGMESGNFNLASHLQQAARVNLMHQTIQEVFGQLLQVRLIEGTTLADWEGTKVRDARLAVMRQTTIARQQTESGTIEGWDGLMEQLNRLYSQSANRFLPQGKARYANEALYLVMDALETLYPENPDETAERSLARALERIASVSEIPASVVAFELERLLAWRRIETGETDTEA